MAGLEEAPVDTAFRNLANRSLVVPDQKETAYALVPMVADFLRLSTATASPKPRCGRGPAPRPVEIYTRLGSPSLEAARATLRECAQEL